MRYNIRELRLARGLKQIDMAKILQSTRQRVSDIELGRLGPHDHELQAICAALDCQPHELQLAETRPRGGQSRPAGDLLDLYRIPPPRRAPEKSAWDHLSSLRHKFSHVLRQLEDRLEGWRPFLQAVRGDSEWETLHYMRELHEGAVPVEVLPHWLGFDRWPICDTKTGRGAGHLLMPALATPQWLAVYQLGVCTPRRYRMDALLVQASPRLFFNLEIDSPGHDLAADDDRRKAIGLPEIRIPHLEIWHGPSLTQLLAGSQPRGNEPAGE